MQEGLANLELEARTQHYPQSQTSPYQSHNDLEPRPSPRQVGPGTSWQKGDNNFKNTNASAYQNINRESATRTSVPQTSPFPKLVDPGPNIPLSDEDKEDVLERARPLVLQSSDPEMQLAWAQDALSWVEAAGQAYLRQTESGMGSPRASTPKTEHQLRIDAINIVSFLAGQQHPKAEFMKGMWLEFGKFGYRVDKKEAFLAYRRAAERGYARAEYRIGMQFESTNNAAKATEHYMKGVDLGDSASNYRLGMMTLLGQHGMQQNYQHGVELIRIAADTADENAPQGAYVYGMLLARELPNITVPEEYLPYDLVDAKLYIEKAAYLGFAKAQLKMAQAYELCQLGCEFEPPLSLHYNALAARQGESEADMAISKWFLCGFEGVFEKNERLAYEYARKAAIAKNPTAEFAMGYFYEIGMSVTMNLEESERWYRLAEEHGNKDAIGRINSIKQNKALSKADHEKVAISRIKSQHGSQKGRRPDKFRTKPTPMPSMSEDTPRSRPVSQAPYPESDLPPQPAPRSHSPYKAQGLRPQNGLIADRPSSAFGIRTPQTGQPYQVDPRPASTIGNPTMQGGRPNYNGQPRPLSAWDVGHAPQPQRQPSPGPPRPPKQPAVNNPNFYPKNVHNQGPAYGHSQQPQPQPQPQQAQMSYNNGHQDPRASAGPNKLSRPERNSASTPQMTRTPVGRPRPQESRQSSVTSMTSPPAGIPQINEPPKPTAPKSKGPATFEEMGIPQTKDESECVSQYATAIVQD